MAQGNREADYRGERYAARRDRPRNENPDDPHYEGTYRPEGEDYHPHGGEAARDQAMGRGQFMRGRGGYQGRDQRPPRDDRGYNFGDPYDQRNYDTGGFGYGGANGSGGGFGVGGNGPQTGGYGSQANYGEGYFGGPSSERDWQSGLGRDGDASYEPGPQRRAYNAQYPYSGQGQGDAYGQGYRPRGRDHHHESYLNWRDNHIRSLDEEYEAYRAEHQSKFDDDFSTWRSNRPGKPEAKAKSNPTAGGEEAERAKRGH